MVCVSEGVCLSVCESFTLNQHKDWKKVENKILFPSLGIPPTPDEQTQPRIQSLSVKAKLFLPGKWPRCRGTVYRTLTSINTCKWPLTDCTVNHTHVFSHAHTLPALPRYLETPEEDAWLLGFCWWNDVFGNLLPFFFISIFVLILKMTDQWSKLRWKNTTDPKGAKD